MFPDPLLLGLGFVCDAAIDGILYTTVGASAVSIASTVKHAFQPSMHRAPWPSTFTSARRTSQIVQSFYTQLVRAGGRVKV